MAESSWPLPPNAVVSDTQYEQLLLGYTPSAVMGSPGDTGIVTAPGSGTRIITIRLGKYALVRGHMWYSGTSDFNMASLAANSSGNPRIDLVVLRYTRSTGAVAAAVITGTPAASPSAPAPTQTLTTSGVFEIPIAQVAVANGATTITAGNITSRETYLSRTPLIGSAAPTTATPGVYLGQLYDQYDSSGVYLRRWWWTGSGWLPPAAPAGTIAYGNRQTDKTFTGTEVGVLRLDNLVTYAGRRYYIETSNLRLVVTSGETGKANIRASTAGAATTSSTILTGAEVSANTPFTPAGSPPMKISWVPGASTTASVLLTVLRSGGSNNVTMTGSSTQPIEMYVVDGGIDPGDTGVDI